MENQEAAEAPPLTDDQLHWRETQRVLAERLGRQPTVAELAAELGWTEERVTGAGRGAWMVTAPAASTGGDQAGMGDALREVQRQLDRLARRVGDLADQARGDYKTE
ncbi:MAG: sigma-70 domain-containing protein [Acidimicrobiales bacterium]